jgi:hypothetical protein
MAKTKSDSSPDKSNIPLLRGIILSLLMGGVMYYASNHSIVVNDIVVAFASIPLLFVILIEMLDRFIDKKSIYTRLYEAGSGVNSTVFVLGGIGVSFVSITLLLANALTLSFGNLSPTVYVVSGIISLYVLAPDTGKEYYILYLFVGATIATFAKYLSIIPGGFHG